MEANTGLIDRNGNAVKENTWLLCDDPVLKYKVCHFVFWNSDNFCYSTIRFRAPQNQKFDDVEPLYMVKHLKPGVAERPEWMTNQRIYDQLKYHNPTAAAQILNSTTWTATT